MKRIILILGSLFLGYAVFAHPADRYFDDDDYDDGDLYEWGVQINNYAAPYSDQFVIWAAREYNFPRNDLRYYLRKGYSPSDLLAGIELSRRSGYPLRAVMDYYRRGKDRNWINVSLHFGIGRSSADFRIILGRFREYSRYWNAYYAHRHPGRVPPPVYRHGWSYFRPDAPHRRPAPKPPRPVVRPRTLRVRKCRATVPPFRRDIRFGRSGLRAPTGRSAPNTVRGTKNPSPDVARATLRGETTTAATTERRIGRKRSIKREITKVIAADPTLRPQHSAPDGKSAGCRCRKDSETAPGRIRARPR